MKNNRSSSAKRASVRKLPRRAPQTHTPSSALDAAADNIIAAIKRIPRGKVSTYGNIAAVAGLPRRARLVGTVLKHLPATRDVPWFRVINAGGRISFPEGSDAHTRQRRKLEAERVVFRGNRVDLNRYGWPPRDADLDELLWKPE